MKCEDGAETFETVFLSVIFLRGRDGDEQQINAQIFICPASWQKPCDCSSVWARAIASQLDGSILALIW